MSQDLVNYDDLEPKSFSFPFRGKSYVLKEPSESASLAFRSAQLKNARMVDGKVSSDIERIYDSQSLLVSLCLYHNVKSNKADGAETEEQVGLNVVRGFPARLVKDLFTKSREMGQLNEDDTEDGLQKQIDVLQERLQKLRDGKGSAKNSSAGGTNTSV